MLDIAIFLAILGIGSLVVYKVLKTLLRVALFGVSVFAAYILLKMFIFT